MNIKELKQFLTKLELKDLEKENHQELRLIGDLMIHQGYALRSISEVNLIKQRMDYPLEEREKVNPTEA